MSSFLHAPYALAMRSERARSPRAEQAVDHWQWRTFAGRLCEFSGSGASATLTLASRVVATAQQQAEPVVWITREASCFFPPDVALHGVDLDALVVIRVPDPPAVTRAADILIRSGGFGLVILDLGIHADIPLAWQTRWAHVVRITIVPCCC